MKARECKRMWCHIGQWNVPSLKLFGRAGFEKAGRVRFTRLFGLSFFIRDGVAYRVISWCGAKTAKRWIPAFEKAVRSLKLVPEKKPEEK